MPLQALKDLTVQATQPITLTNLSDMRRSNICQMDRPNRSKIYACYESTFRTPGRPAVRRVRRHVPLACLDGGKEVGRPLYRVAAEFGTKRCRQKFECPDVAETFRPASPEIEGSVPGDEMETPSPARVRLPPHTAL